MHPQFALRLWLNEQGRNGSITPVPEEMNMANQSDQRAEQQIKDGFYLIF